MHIKNIIIVMGEPYSTFSEIIGKYFKKYKKFKKRIILIGNTDLLNKQLKKLGHFINFNQIKKVQNAINDKINIINVEFKYKKIFSQISPKSSNYINGCFNVALNILNNNKDCILINGPISKKSFLKKKYLGITEFLSKKTKSKNEVMLIYNKELSVSPITTHIPIKYVAKNITKKKIINNILTINNFFRKTLKKKAKFAILGLNPHCETIDKFSEEEKVIKPSIKYLRNRGIYINGPFSADTFFLRNNMRNYNVVIGLYHDQVLTPIKTLFNFNAINITLGLPFIRISPDHGPNTNMLSKNRSDASSLKYAMKFIKDI